MKLRYEPSGYYLLEELGLKYEFYYFDLKKGGAVSEHFMSGKFF